MAQSKQANSEFSIKANGRIDFEKPPKGKIFVPVPTNEEDIRLRGVDRRFVTFHKYSGTTMRVVMELVDQEDEAGAKAFVSEVKRECKNAERDSRCKIKSPKTGAWICCPDCISCYGEDCPKQQGMAVEEGGLVSFEDLAETVKSSAYNVDPTADEAIVNVMWDEFKRKLSDEEESFVKLIELNEQGFVAKEIMQMLGKSKTWYYDSWKMIHKRWIDYNKD